MRVRNDGFLKGLAAPELCNHHQLSSAISVFWPRTRGLSPVIPRRKNSRPSWLGVSKLKPTPPFQAIYEKETRQ